MPWTNDFSPDEENQLSKDIQEASSRAYAYSNFATPQMSDIAGGLADMNPDTDPGALLAYTNAVANGEITWEQANSALQRVTELTLTDEGRYVDQGGSKPWYRRIVDGVGDVGKLASRWTMAGLNFIPQTVTNSLARLYAAPFLDRGIEDLGYYERPQTGVFDGWFASTDLGAMFSGQDAGEGFFIGEAAKQYQEQRVLEYRGGFVDTDGKLLAFTPGRMVGGLFWQPGQGQYNLVSGLVDAAIAFSVPALPAAKGLTQAARTYSGLTDGIKPLIRMGKVDSFLKSGTGNALMRRLAAIKDVDEMVNFFKGDIDLRIIDDLLKADTPELVEESLRRYLGSAVEGGPAIGIADINQLPTLGLRERFSSTYTPNIAGARERGLLGQELRRQQARSLPKRVFALSFGDELESTNSIKSLTALMDTFRLDEFVHEGKTISRNAYLQRAVQHGLAPNDGGLKELRDLTHSMIVSGLKNQLSRRVVRRREFTDEAIEKTARAFLKQYTGVEDALYGMASTVSDGLDNMFVVDPGDALIGLVDDVIDTGAGIVIGEGQTIKGIPRQNPYEVIDSETGEVAWLVGGARGTAMLSSEMMRQMIIMPDFDKLRRATSRFAWMFEKNSLIGKTSIGDANLLVSMLDNVQNRVWRPMTMMTGGYITRNMADSMLRTALAPGIDSGPKHPFTWMKLVLKRENRGDLLGYGWDVDEAAARLNVMNKRVREAVGKGARDIEPAQRALAGYRRSAFAFAPRPMQKGSAEHQRYVRGIADQIHLLTEDPFARLIAEGVDWDVAPGIDNLLGRADDFVGQPPRPNTLKEWLETTDEGREYARQTHGRWQNKFSAGGTSGKRYSYPFLKQDGTLHEENWRRFSQDVKDRISRETLGSDDLRSVLKNNPTGMPEFRRIADDGTEEYLNAFKTVGQSVGVDTDYAGYTDEFLDHIRKIVDEALDSNNASRLPELVKYRIGELDIDDAFGLGRRKMMDKLTDHFFGHVFAGKEAFVNRSPVARQYYYTVFDELADSLRPEDARYAISRLQFAVRQRQRDYVNALKKATKRQREFSAEDYKNFLNEAKAQQLQRVAMFDSATEKVRQQQVATDALQKVVNDLEAALRRGGRSSSPELQAAKSQAKSARAELERLRTERAALKKEVDAAAERATKIESATEVNLRTGQRVYRIEGFDEYRVPRGPEGLFERNMATWVDDQEYARRLDEATQKALPAAERKMARQAQTELRRVRIQIDRYEEAGKNARSVKGQMRYTVVLDNKTTLVLNEADYLRNLKRLQDEADALVDAASPGVLRDADFARLLDETRRGVSETDIEGFNIDFAIKYLGGKKRWERLIYRANADEALMTGDRTFLSLEQVDTAAKAYAAEQTKRLFYDAAEKSNFADVMRIIAPFGTAWYEVLRRYSKEALRDPNRLKNTGATIRGLRDADPEGDGRGFFYKDPVTGETMFNFPADSTLMMLVTGFGGYVLGQTVGPKGIAGQIAGGIAAAATARASQEFLTPEGLSPEVVAPVRSLSMGFNVLPGFGPVVQMAYKNILGDKPVARDFADLVIPYGAEDFTPEGLSATLMPAWADKIWSAIRDDPAADNKFADMYMEVTRALAANGEYDLTDPAEKAQLERDARKYAKNLLMFQGLGQFTGPVRPSVVFDVPVKFRGELVSDDIKALVENGNIYSNHLAAVYRMFQEDDFFNAPQKFIETFGEDALLYTASSTKTNVAGLGVSEQFGQFENQNAEFASNHPDVFGYFAPNGNDFDYQVYRRQLDTGQRQRIDDPTVLIEAAQAVIGKALFRDFRRKQGRSTSQSAEIQAAEYKNWLFEAYPGYATAELNINDRNEVLTKLSEASRDPLIQTTEIGLAASMYFSERDRLIGIANERRRQGGSPIANINPLSGSDNVDLRLQLRLLGERLAQRYPGFDRMWSRELFNEVEV